ncbi:MAG TPA: DUF308 domain-containing protein [Bacteroidaceae bacterium]|nr:DUF308 domain-containing protein [Bacteroidaceae bacterium]
MSKRFFVPLLRGLAALGLGYVFIAYSGLAATWIAQILGIALVVPSAILLIHYIYRVFQHEERFFPFLGLGNFVLGIWLLIDPMIFVNIFNIFLGILLILFGLQQFMSAWLFRHVARLYRIYYAVPTLLILGGLFSLFSTDKNIVTMLVGFFMVFYAINELLRWIFVDLRKSPVKPSIHSDKEDSDDDYIEIISEDVDDVDSDPVSDIKSDL